MDAIVVDIDERARHRFDAWAAGRTGYPIVASFLVKDLHLSWQWRARRFLRHLVDGDLASNNYGWQWTAGTGTDAAPYFRVFNPTSRSERFDPDGTYIRTWVTELAEINESSIHVPGANRPSAYPTPIVDHAVERDEALRRYKSLRAASR